jgi:hypothetical protein
MTLIASTGLPRFSLMIYADDGTIAVTGLKNVKSSSTKLDVDWFDVVP